MKIRLAANWGLSAKEMFKIFNRQTPGSKGIWNELESTLDMDEADYVLVQDSSDEKITDDSKVIYFAREPSYVWKNKRQKVWKRPCAFSYYYEKEQTWLPQTWWVSIPFDKLKVLVVDKSRNLSVIDSGKTRRQDHRNRKNLILDLVKKYPQQFDLFGGIVKTNSNGRPPFKKVLPSRDKSLGLLPYRYNLAIENGSAKFYFSEKFVDPILCGATPIYWGCPQISKFFPEGSYIWIDIHEKNVAKKIIDIIRSDFHERNLGALAEAKELILEKYNLWPTLEKAITGRII